MQKNTGVTYEFNECRGERDRFSTRSLLFDWTLSDCCFINETKERTRSTEGAPE